MEEHKRGGFAGGVMKLVAGRGLSIAISLGTAPIVARLFAPGDFGIYGVIVAVGTWITSFACLGYFQAIPLTSDRWEMRALLRLCGLITLVLVGLSLLVPWAGRDLLIRLLGEPAAGPFLWFVPLFFLLNSLANITEHSLSRLERFGGLALFNFAVTNLTRLLTIAYGVLVGAGALGLILGNLAGLGGALLLGAAVLLPALRSPGPAPEQPWTLVRVARRHSQFPRVQMWNWVLAATSQSLPVLLLGGFFGAAVAGMFVYARNIILMPKNLLSTSVAQVFYPQGAREWEQGGSLGQSIRRSLKLLVLTTSFPAVLLALLGPVLFAVVFGERWREAGVYAQILSPWMFMEIVATPIALVLLITRRAHLALIYNLVLVVVRVGALVAGGLWAGSRVALLIFSLGSTAVMLHQLIYCLRLGGAGVREPAGLLLREAGRSLALLIPLALPAWWGLLPGWLVLVLAAAAAAIHFGLLLGREPMVRRELDRLLGRKERG